MSLKVFFLSISNEIFIRKLWTRRRFKQNLSDQRDICHMLVKDRFTRRNNWVPYYTCVLRRMTRVAVDPLILRSQSNWPARPGFPAPYMSLSSYRGWHRYLLECLNPQLHLMQRKSHIHFGLEVSCRFPLILFTGRLKNLKWNQLERCRCYYSSIDYTVSFVFYNWSTLTSKFVCESPLDLTKVRLQASGDKRMIESIRKTVKTAGANSDCVAISHTHSCSLINLVQV